MKISVSFSQVLVTGTINTTAFVADIPNARRYYYI